MVTKSKKGGPGGKKRIKVLKLDKQTIKELTKGQARQIRGATGIFCANAVKSAVKPTTTAG